MTTFAVFDIETTGISPQHTHRVVEFAVVCVDAAGNTVDEWESVVDPKRDVGAGHIHGLTASLLYGAPAFDEIAGNIVARLSGRVPVAHNLSFDTRFVWHEFQRMGVTVPLTPPLGLCTMRMASRYLPGAGRSLEDCCEAIGFEISKAHAALEDARAAAALLVHYLSEDDEFHATWEEEIGRAARSAWPPGPMGQTKGLSRKQVAQRKPTRSHFLGRIAARAPRSSVHPEANSYLAVLDRVLLDRFVSQHEEEELVAVAGMMGLSHDDVVRLHRTYLQGLGRNALADGQVTKDERQDLEAVAKALGLSESDVAESIRPTEAALAESISESGCHPIGGFRLKSGSAVVFTGEAEGVPRESLETQARELGLRVTSSVSGKTSLVVAADPDSSSGKARKARELGIPIVGYGAYFRMLEGMQCDASK